MSIDRVFLFCYTHNVINKGYVNQKKHMKKTFNQTIERACTGVFFWAVFVIYALFKGLKIDHLETLVIAEITAVVSPYFIRYIANNFK